jgi:hypothetical protein
MKYPYCGSRVEAGDDICLNCERPLDATLLREQTAATQAAKQAQAAARHKVTVLAADQDVEQKAAHIRTSLFYIVRISPVVFGLALVSLLLIIPQLGVQSYAFATAIVVAGAALLFLGISALVYGSTKREIRRGLAAPLVHWTYSEQEWQQFTAQAWRRQMKSTWLITGILAGVMLVPGLVAILASHAASEALIFAGIFLGFAVSVGLLLFLTNLTTLQFRRRQDNREAYVSLDGVVQGGWYVASLSGLYRVEYQSGSPDVVRLRIRRAGYSSGGANTYTQIVEVPVPHGHKAEAEQVVNDLMKAKGL